MASTTVNRLFTRMLESPANVCAAVARAEVARRLGPARELHDLVAVLSLRGRLFDADRSGTVMCKCQTFKCQTFKCQTFK